MKLVTREIYEKMMNLNLLRNDKNNKDFYITCRDKKGKRKKYYVVEKILKDYLKKSSERNWVYEK